MSKPLFKCDECGEEVDSIKADPQSNRFICAACAEKPAPLRPEDAEDLL